MDFALIDAFADRPFAGNPAAVVRGSPADDSLLQSIAMEFNQAETAFVAPLADGRFSLRWFTPLREVPLCGHATLAAARALWDWGDAKSDRIFFDTGCSGDLICTRSASGEITLDFPATPPTPVPMPADAAAVLGVDRVVECLGTTAMNLTAAALGGGCETRQARTQHARNMARRRRHDHRPSRRARHRHRQPLLRPRSRD